ncbi:MAG: preQ(1) synthase [Muribaculaceae bacterium]|nr:preQ(1) synthase [Muribaculaceae bacterium]
MDRQDEKSLTLLGNKGVKYPTDYDPTLLETFVNRHPERDYLVTLLCPEFTTLCPITSQPDFGKIVINYIPAERMVESKSLKLYLFSFRNHGDFHEDVVNVIMRDLIDLMQPRYIEVTGLFMPRGGISIHPFANWADADHQALAAERMAQAMNSIFAREN